MDITESTMSSTRIRNSSSSGIILEEYVWHPVEERVLIKDVFYSGLRNYTVYYVNENFIRIENSSGNFTEKYVYQEGMLVSQNLNGTKQAIHNDHLGMYHLFTFFLV